MVQDRIDSTVTHLNHGEMGAILPQMRRQDGRAGVQQKDREAVLCLSLCALQPMFASGRLTGV